MLTPITLPSRSKVGPLGKCDKGKIVASVYFGHGKIAQGVRPDTPPSEHTPRSGVVFCDTSGRFSFNDQLLQSGFDHGDLFVDPVDWQAEVVPRSCPGPELEH